MNNWHISRRRMLKGLGATIALPFLQAMVPPGMSHIPASRKAKRMAFLFMPNGVHPDRWTPEGVGSQFALSPTLQPLQSLKDKILVFTELMNKNSDTHFDGHYTKTANFLTCMKIARTTGTDISSGGISLDQLVAQRVGKETLFPSLEYGLDPIKTGIDTAVGLTRLYGANISWKNATQPCSKEIHPRFAFDRLFGRYVPGKPAPEANPYKQSVLDLVKDDVRGLQRNLGIEDRNKLEEYLDAVRSVEKRLGNQPNLKDFEARITPDIQKELKRLDVRIEDYAEHNSGVDVTEKVRLMMDIIALAFWSDATRVCTFMFGNSVSTRNFSFLEGVNGNHHSISHHKKDPRQLEQYFKINHWHIEQYAYLLNKLDSIKEEDGTLLDHSMVLFGSGLRDGDRHSPHNLPIVLAGKGGGTLKTGQHLTYAPDTPLANLYLSMLRAMDMPRDYFGDSTGEFCEIYSDQLLNTI